MLNIPNRVLVSYNHRTRRPKTKRLTMSPSILGFTLQANRPKTAKFKFVTGPTPLPLSRQRYVSRRLGPAYSDSTTTVSYRVWVDTIPISRTIVGVYSLAGDASGISDVKTPKGPKQVGMLNKSVRN
jgi:hypothetical protein